MSATTVAGCSFAFSPDHQRWVRAEVPVAATPTEPLRIATLNVLANCFPWFVEVMISSRERMAALLRQVRSLDPTILGLNEVTPSILGQLLNDPFIRETYYITEIDTDPKTSSLGRHGCILLSKIFFEQVHRITMAPVAGVMSRPVVLGVFLSRPGGPRFGVASQHTQAYQTPENAELRLQQVTATAAAVRELLGDATGIPAAFVLMGDLNLHYVCEDKAILDAELFDLWSETHHDPASGVIADGFTYDSLVNKMIPLYVPGENRRMRLDRILCSAGFLADFAVVAACEMWATERIHSKRALWTSDHFGLSIDVQSTSSASATSTLIAGDPTDPLRPVRRAMRDRANEQREKSSYNAWTLTKSLPRQVLAITLRGLCGF